MDHLLEVPEAHPFWSCQIRVSSPGEDEPTDDGVNDEEPLEQDDQERRAGRGTGCVCAQVLLTADPR